MTQADWAALKAAGDAGGTAYLEALNAQTQQRNTWRTAADAAARPGDGTSGAGGTAPSGGTTPPAGVSMTTDANGNPITTGDAVAILSTELTTWGFGQDALDWARAQIQSNSSIDQVLYSLRQQPFYVNSIFGQVAAQRTKAGLPAMTEAQILTYKDYATGLAQQAGLPQGFLTDTELTTLMGHDVSTSELDARITQGYTAALKAPPDVLNQLQTYYGVTTGHLAAYFLDPTKALPLIQQQFATAQIGAEATRTGYGALGQPQALNLAQLGTTDAQAKQGFTDLAKQAQLFTALPGSGEQGITQETQLGAEFSGNAADQHAIQQRAQERTAVFAAGGHFAETQNKGITGLGNVQRNG